MHIFLENNPYKFDVEQTAIMLMPARSPRVTDAPPPRAVLEEDYAVCGLKIAEKSAMATCMLKLDGKRVTKACRYVYEEGDEDRREGEIRHTVRRSVYKAYTELTGKRPAWGALSGVRPAKLARGFISDGLSPADTVKKLMSRYYIAEEKALLAVQCAAEAIELKAGLSPSDTAVYIGVPYCPTRCAYCSFFSRAADDAPPGQISKYLDALIAEISAAALALSAAGRTVKALYIGGGTPTTLSADALALLLENSRRLPLVRDCEITLECGRPDTMTREKLQAAKAGGVTRVSVNPQSFSERVLSAIGRVHGIDAVYEAYELARGLGFEVNMDLIAGLPEDSLAAFADGVRSAVGLRPENITVHTLAIKKGSAFAAAAPTLPPPDTVAAMLDAARAELVSAGYFPYYLYRQKYMSGSFENVGYSLEGRICEYNIYMMEELLPVIACGAGAATKLVSPDEREISRLTNPKFPEEYIARIDELTAAKRALHLKL